MGGVVKAITGVFGGGTKMPSVPEQPDYEAERKRLEEEATKKRQATAATGMSGTILGGSTGGSDTLGKKKLLGE